MAAAMDSFIQIAAVFSPVTAIKHKLLRDLPVMALDAPAFAQRINRYSGSDPSNTARPGAG